jgi:thymidine kinase
MPGSASLPGALEPEEHQRMVIQPKGTGWIEVICGPMFSGKTEELIRRLRRAEIARQKVQVFKPAIDTRYSESDVVSHSAQRTGAVAVASSRDIAELVRLDTEVVGIDESQFFDIGVVAVADRLAAQGRRVIVAGLDQDYRGVPFEPIPALMAVADYVTKLLAICMRCGNPASRTQRMSTGKERVEIGAQDRYEARCRLCFEGDPTHARVERARQDRVELHP